MITQNFINILRDIMQRAGTRYGAYPLVDGPNRIYYTTQIAQDEDDSQYIGTTHRVQIGDGNTPATRNDYKLENQLLTGFTKSVVYSHAIDNDGDHVLIMDATITNTGSDTLTIREIGYTIPTRFANTQGGTPVADTMLIMLVDRTVLDTPITIEPNETKTIRYTLKTVENIVSEHANLQSKTATENGTVTPDQGYDGLSSVVVNVSGGGSIPNENLCCNWDFSNAVNTRGNSEYTQDNTSAFTIDGWKLWRGTLNMVSGGLTLKNSYQAGYTTFLQFWPNAEWVKAALNKTLTVSLLTESELITDTFVLSSATGDKSTGATSADGKIMFWVYRDSATQVTFNIRFLDGALNAVSRKIIACKIEAGSAQTLAVQNGGAWSLIAHQNQDTEYIKVRASATNS